MVKRKNSSETVFVLLIFCVFAISSLLVVLIGANVYRSIVDHMEENNSLRASLTYVANKVRSAPPGSAQLEEIDGRPVLVLHEEAGGQGYNTYIFEEEGILRELFTGVDTPFDPAGGDAITGAQDFSMQMENGLLLLRAGASSPAELRLKLP